MYHGGSHGGGMHMHGGASLRRGSDADEVLGKVYDSRVMSRLPKYLSPVKSWLALGASGMMIRSLAQLAIPYLIATATDRFIQTGNLGGLNIIALIFIGVALMAWGGQYIETLFLAYAGQSVLYRLRTEMFTHLQKLSLEVIILRGDIYAPHRS